MKSSPRVSFRHFIFSRKHSAMWRDHLTTRNLWSRGKNGAKHVAIKSQKKRRKYTFLKNQLVTCFLHAFSDMRKK